MLVGERNDGEKRSIRQDDVEQIGGPPCMELARGSGSGEQAHDQPEIVTCDVDQIALVDVGAAAQPGASHATTIEDQSEAALHPGIAGEVDQAIDCGGRDFGVILCVTRCFEIARCP